MFDNQENSFSRFFIADTIISGPVSIAIPDTRVILETLCRPLPLFLWVTFILYSRSPSCLRFAWHAASECFRLVVHLDRWIGFLGHITCVVSLLYCSSSQSVTRLSIGYQRKRCGLAGTAMILSIVYIPEVESMVSVMSSGREWMSWGDVDWNICIECQDPRGVSHPP